MKTRFSRWFWSVLLDATTIGSMFLVGRSTAIAVNQQSTPAPTQLEAETKEHIDDPLAGVSPEEILKLIEDVPAETPAPDTPPVVEVKQETPPTPVIPKVETPVIETPHLDTRAEFTAKGGWERVAKTALTNAKEFITTTTEDLTNRTSMSSELCMGTVVVSLETLLVTDVWWDDATTPTCDYARNDHPPLPSIDSLNKYLESIP